MGCSFSSREGGEEESKSYVTCMGRGSGLHDSAGDGEEGFLLKYFINSS